MKIHKILLTTTTVLVNSAMAASTAGDDALVYGTDRVNIQAGATVAGDKATVMGADVTHDEKLTGAGAQLLAGHFEETGKPVAGESEFVADGTIRTRVGASVGGAANRWRYVILGGAASGDGVTVQATDNLEVRVGATIAGADALVYGMDRVNIQASGTVAGANATVMGADVTYDEKLTGAGAQLLAGHFEEIRQPVAGESEFVADGTIRTGVRASVGGAANRWRYVILGGAASDNGVTIHATDNLGMLVGPTIVRDDPQLFIWAF